MPDPVPSQSSIEWGIVYVREPDTLWRGPMTEGDAQEWIREFEDDGGKAGMFVVARREVGSWEVVR